MFKLQMKLTRLRILEYSVATCIYLRLLITHNLIKSVSESHRFVFLNLSLRVSIDFITFSPFHHLFLSSCFASWADGGRMISGPCRFTCVRPARWTTSCVVVKQCQRKSQRFDPSWCVAGCILSRSRDESHTEQDDESNWSRSVRHCSEMPQLVLLLQSMASSKKMASDIKLLKWNTSECRNGCYVISDIWEDGRQKPDISVFCFFSCFRIWTTTMNSWMSTSLCSPK